MVILNLGVCPYLDLEVSRLVWCFLMKVKKLKVWKVERFNWELTLLISGSNFGYGSWNRSIVSFVTSMQNLRSIGVDLLWFGLSLES